MDQHWIYNLDNQTALIVPTRSLANTLKEQIAEYHIQRGETVWFTPTILLWREYLHQVWSLNLSHSTSSQDAKTIITDSQSTLLWTQVIESSRQKEKSFTLLDVQQTTRAVIKSWKLMNDWQLPITSLELDQSEDSEQFLKWTKRYCELTDEKGVMDQLQLQNHILSMELIQPYQHCIWCNYDLITAAQKKFIEISGSKCEHTFTNVVNSSETDPALNRQHTNRVFDVYPDFQTEIVNVLHNARQQVEQNPDVKINIVIPDLQHQFELVKKLARDVFYADRSPLDIQQIEKVYRFSLGQPLKKWPAIQTALIIIRCFNNRLTVSDLSYLLRNEFVSKPKAFIDECRSFERWLKYSRIKTLSIDLLPNLYQQCLSSSEDVKEDLIQANENSKLLSWLHELSEFKNNQHQKLTEQKQNSGYSTLPFVHWVTLFEEWLGVFGWECTGTASDMNSVQFQLFERWQNILQEFADLQIVQRRIGFNRAFEILGRLCQEAVFQPQAVSSPIFISGVFESIGRQADVCFLIGMDQTYPAPPVNDAFLSNRHLKKVGFPDADVQDSFNLAKQVTDNLLRSAKQQFISFSIANNRDREISNQVSPLFRGEQFEHYCSGQFKTESPPVQLESFVDSQGLPLQDARYVSGGSRIFEYQSVCAFRAFVTFRLGFLREFESEFGLDALDRGNIIHNLLDRVWQKLQNQDTLISLNEQQLDTQIVESVNEAIQQLNFELSEDKIKLLQHEKPRLVSLVSKWLEVEKTRPIGFSVIETEEKRTAEIGGIQFSYIIDRLDVTDDGRTLIIDYKTGTVNRNDWLGSRLKSPQLPLYSLAHDAIKKQPLSGITFAKIDPIKPEFIELSEADIIRPTNKRVNDREQQWNDHRQLWPSYFEQLAEDFLEARAHINPIDEATCQYCELKSVCRISQLREQSHDQ